ncbi:hypothetical protein D9M68_955480 [compost metagenome]
MPVQRGRLLKLIMHPYLGGIAFGKMEVWHRYLAINGNCALRLAGKGNSGILYVQVVADYFLCPGAACTP